MLSKRTFVVSILLLSFFRPFGQVNLQTGSAVFSLPMFNWQDDKSHLSSTIGLSYSSGNGLKVSDIASNVGQGWNLIAGGVITRMQVGEPDDQPPYTGSSQYGNGNDFDLTKYPAGYLYANPAPSQGCPNSLQTYPTYGGQGVQYAQRNVTAQDRQQDYFSFQFNGKTGMFILDPNNMGVAVPLGDTKMQISFQLDPTMQITQGIRTTITSFTITDIDGLIYKFTLHGLTKLLQANFSNADGTQIQNQPKIGNGGIYCQSAFDTGPLSAPWINRYLAYPYIINNWYLSEIDDPFTKRKITFTYNTANLNDRAGQDISYNNSSDQYIVISYKRSITQSLDIASITYPDGHIIYFDYGSFSRADYLGERALSDVDIWYKTRHLSQYRLNTSYFILDRYGTPITPYQQSVSRLCLRSVTKIGVDLKEDSPPYQFDYYTGSGGDDVVPQPFSYAKDIWGYYNGTNSIASNSPLSGSTIPVSLTAAIPSSLPYNALKGLCFLNDNVSGTYYNAKPGYAQNGLLRQIVYPTGGSLVYQYAQNSGSFIGNSSVLNVGGVHVSQTSSYDGGYSNGCSNPVVTQYNYVMNGAGSASSLWGLETPVNSVVSNNSWKEEKQTIHFSWSHPFGECLWHYVYPGIMTQYEAVSLDTWQHIKIFMTDVLGVMSVVSTVDDVINVIASTGFLTVAAVVLDVISAVLSYILTCPQQSKYTPNTIYYNFDLNEVGPLPAQFKRVEITESPGTIGKTVQQFTQGDPNDPGGPDYPLWFPAGSNTAFSAKQRYAPWAYGLPKLTTVYDVNGNKIKETQNVYDFTNAQEAIVDYLQPPGQKFQYFPTFGCKCQVINNYSLRSDHWTNAAISYVTAPGNADMQVDLYKIYTGRLQLKTTYERVYRVNDSTQFVQTSTSYFYNNTFGYNGLNTPSSNFSNYDPFLIAILQSNGDIVYKNIKYNTDYNTGILATMAQKNMVSVPISTYNYIQKAGSSSYMSLGEKVTEYAQLPDSNVMPSRILEQRFASPGSAFTAYSGPTTTNYAAYKIPQIFTYDANDNLTGLQDEGNRTVTNIYDYNDKYIVATVINANPVIDKPAYTSFESGDLSRSGWTLTGTGAVYSTSSVATGSQSLVLNGNTLTASLNTSEPYMVSFWANTSNVALSAGASLAKSGPIYNGLRYYEYNMAVGTASVSLNGNSIIDELRLYPKAARMRTTTYDPLIGKTSECDENNRITYYTYDNLGRMQFVQDESHNVVKMYEYNNVSASKQTGCPATFGNKMISEQYTRICAAGYVGGTVTYTVPANTYTSTISQQNADVQAEFNILTSGPIYANANASCSSIYYNTVQSKMDTTQTCGPGLVGGTVTYTVPAHTDSSIISQADANQQALNDIAANAQVYANSPANAACNIDTAADWEWSAGDSLTAPDSSYCLSMNGQLPPHLFVKATDVNPNSPTYNHTQWEDDGANSPCISNAYYNASQSGVFIKNNCANGTAGTSVTYTVFTGAYNSTVSQATANQLASNDIAANGQNNANTKGTCCTPTYSFASGISSIVNTTSISGTTVSFTWVFNYPSGAPTNFQLGTVTGACSLPTSTRTIPFIQGATTYNLIIAANGIVILQVVSGPVPTGGGVALPGTYDLNQNAFYSVAESGSFTRNNCPSGQTGSGVTYSVQQYSFNSLTSQAAANQLAINSVNANGQSYANANGTCSSNCSFNWTATGLSNHTATISSSGTTGSFSISLVPVSSGYTGGTLGNITGGCNPSVTRLVTVTDAAMPSRTWNVTITSAGVISISLASGPSVTNTPPPAVIIGNYNL